MKPHEAHRINKNSVRAVRARLAKECEDRPVVSLLAPPILVPPSHAVHSYVLVQEPSQLRVDVLPLPRTRPATDHGQARDCLHLGREVLVLPGVQSAPVHGAAPEGFPFGAVLPGSSVATTQADPVLELGARFKPLVELAPQRMQLKVVANTECATAKAMWLDS